MSEHLGLKERINQFIQDIMGVEGVTSCVLASRDGILMGKAFTSGVSVPSFAAMTATMLASAEAAASISHIQPPERIMVKSPDAQLMVISAGERTLLAAVFTTSADIEEAYLALKKIATDIGEVL